MPHQRAVLEQKIWSFATGPRSKPSTWRPSNSRQRDAEGNSYRHYAGKWFTLDSTADEQNTRRLIVRAEQIFAAYRQILPPRSEPRGPPRLVVLASMDQYQALLVKLGLMVKIQNPAVFLEDKNVVAIGSDLARLAAVNVKVSTENDQLRKELGDLEGRLPERLRAVADSRRKSGYSNGDIARGRP